MAESVKVEIDTTALNAVLAELQKLTGGTGVVSTTTVRASSGASAPRAKGREQIMGGFVQAQPGGTLPSIPRGLRTTMGQFPGGYGAVAGYQKVLWLEQGIQGVMKGGVSMASVVELYTFLILIAVDMMAFYKMLKESEEQRKKDIMEVSDIHNSRVYKEWERLQWDIYRGRKS